MEGAFFAFVWFSFIRFKNLGKFVSFLFLFTTDFSRLESLKFAFRFAACNTVCDSVARVIAAAVLAVLSMVSKVAILVLRVMAAESCFVCFLCAFHRSMVVILRI